MTENPAFQPSNAPCLADRSAVVCRVADRLFPVENDSIQLKIKIDVTPGSRSAIQLVNGNNDTAQKTFKILSAHDRFAIISSAFDNNCEI
jgi:hypothetical protein